MNPIWFVLVPIAVLFATAYYIFVQILRGAYETHVRQEHWCLVLSFLFDSKVWVRRGWGGMMVWDCARCGRGGDY